MNDERKPTPLYIAFLWVLIGAIAGYYVGITQTRRSARIHGAAHYVINDINESEFRWGPKPP